MLQKVYLITFCIKIWTNINFLRLDVINGVLWCAWGETGPASNGLSLCVLYSSITNNICLCLTPVHRALSARTHIDRPRLASVNQQFLLFIFMAPWPVYQNQYQWEYSSARSVQNMPTCPTSQKPPHGVAFHFCFPFVHMNLVPILFNWQGDIKVTMK